MHCKYNITSSMIQLTKMSNGFTQVIPKFINSSFNVFSRILNESLKWHPSPYMHDTQKKD